MKIALYTGKFLTPSMTFIFRQLKTFELSGWKITILTGERIHQELFPHDEIFVKKKTILESLINRIYRILNIRYAGLAKSREEYFFNIIKLKKPDVLHAHFGPSGIEASVLAKRAKIPLIITFHGQDASALLNQPGYIKQLKKISYNTLFITVSKYMKRVLHERLGNVNIHVHYIGIPIDDFIYVRRNSMKTKHIANNTINFLQVSNFVEKKGHIYTINAFSRAAKKNSNIRLRFVGNGPLMDKMKELVSKLGMQKIITFLGRKKTAEVNIIMASSDCFLHHSVTADDGDMEGIPTVIMEAMSTGLPIISTLHSGIPELVEHGISGYLIKEKDVNKYTEMIIKVLSDDGSMGRVGHSCVEQNFNMEKQTSMLIDSIVGTVNE